MDPFEASTQFSQILRSLTPSIQNLTRAAHFALKNYQAEDYLSHSILEVVQDPKIDLNTKSTIFQFIEVLVHELRVISEQPKSPYNYPYVTVLKESLPKVLLQTLPGSNCSSLYNVYCSLKNISRTLSFSYDELDVQFNSIPETFTVDDVQNIAANIAFPEVTEDEEPETQDRLVTCWKLLIKKKKQSQYERLRQLEHKPMVTEKAVDEEEMFNLRMSRQDQALVDGQPLPQPNLLSKRQILARMEDDRETHKRSKETLWVVNRPREANAITEDEFLTSYWNKQTVLSPEEDQVFLNELEELNSLVALSYKDSQV